MRECYTIEHDLDAPMWRNWLLGAVLWAGYRIILCFGTFKRKEVNHGSTDIL